MTESQKKHDEQEVDAVVNAKAGDIFPSSPHALSEGLHGHVRISHSV